MPDPRGMLIPPASRKSLSQSNSLPNFQTPEEVTKTFVPGIPGFPALSKQTVPLELLGKGLWGR